MSNVPMVPGKGIGTSEEQEMLPCIFQHLRILGEEGLLAEFALKAHVKLKDITCLLPNTQMGWACFSPCIQLVGHLALKPHESVSRISSTLEKHPMIKASIEEEFVFFWTLWGICRLQTSCTLSTAQCHTLRHSPALDYRPRRPQDQPVSVLTPACV